MSDVEHWLNDLGLGQYADIFAEQEIAWEILPDLNEQDLVGLAIPLGHRKKLLKAISHLSPESNSANAVRAIQSPDPSSQTYEAERRHLTIVFCDLVGSTALSEKLDPEDLRSIVHAFQDCCAGIVTRMEGFVARYMGDGILIYFGYPRAHEDDAERALRTSLEIIDTVRNLPTKSGEALQTRIGIATGLVVVGDLIGAGAAQEIEAVGETPNIAARLQALAEPNTAVLEKTTRHLVHGLFDFTDLGEQDLKGISDPIQTWRVTTEKMLESRFEATRGARLVPFVDREHELALLLDRWERARTGKGQLVFVSGEPGIGKSRLLWAFMRHSAAERFDQLQFYCSRYHQSSAFHPFVDHVRRAAGLASTDTPAQKIDKIAVLLSEVSEDVSEAASLYAFLMSIPGEDQDRQALNPQGTKEKAFEFLVEQVTKLSRDKPLLVVIEDAHWIDPSSLELLNMIVDRLQSLRILLIVTYRSDFPQPLLAHSQASLLKLNRLRLPQCQSIVEHLAECKGVPIELLNEIVTRADGVPLFVEELTKAVLESEILIDRGDRYELIPQAPALAIPTTLNGSLMARLDRNPGTREIAQIGSVFGREFSYEMISTISQLPNPELREALDFLVDSELLLRSDEPPQINFRFRHALVQDAAYESLLLSKRRSLHTHVAQIFEDQFPDVAATEPAVLAHHFSHAGLPGKAIAYCVKAASLAVARAAMTEAIAISKMGLDLLPDLPEEDDRRIWELELQVTRGNALRAAKGLSAPDTGQAWDRARELCGNGNDAPHLLQVLYGQFLFHQGNANIAQALDLGQDLLALGERQQNPIALVGGHSAVGRTAFGQGDFGAARTHLEHALSFDDTALRQATNGVRGPESRVLNLCYLSWTLFAQGHCEQALDRCRESISVAEGLSQTYDLVVAHGNACYIHHFRQDSPAVATSADTVIALAEENGFPAWLSLGQIFRGWALAQTGQADAGVALVGQAVADHRATGEKLEVSYFIGLLAECFAKAGRPEEGVEILAEAVELVEETGERWFESELHRLRGELILASSQSDAAEAATCFRRALDVASAQDARMWELRAGLSLARQWFENGMQSEANELLEPMVKWFKTDAGISDLEEAQALLADLGDQ